MGFTQPVHNGLLDQLGIDYDARGNVKVNAKKQTSIDKIFACGDVEAGARERTGVVRIIVKHGVVDAVRRFIQKHPYFSGVGIVKFSHLQLKISKAVSINFGTAFLLTT